jgi:hypothetical protein
MVFNSAESLGLKSGKHKLAEGKRGKSMAMSTCIKCGEHGFELANSEQTGGLSKFTLVQCKYCGVPVGAVDTAIRGEIEVLRRQITSINERLTAITQE